MTETPVPDTVVVDRLEGELAVLETATGLQDVARARLPREARQGDHLRAVHADDGSLRYLVDEAATLAARRTNQRALDSLNAGDDGGDLQL